MTTPGTQYSLFESAEALPVEQGVQTPSARRFSDYVVYVDESGDHSLASIDKDSKGACLWLPKPEAEAA